MILESRLANALGFLADSVLCQIEQSLFRVKLNYCFSNLPKDQVLAALRQDKKNRQGKISFILPTEIGKVQEVLLSPEEVEKNFCEVVL